MNIEQIQAYLNEHDLDGWLMADFHGRNDIAMRMLGITGMVTRRSFYFIPSDGEPTALVHNIEAAKFTAVPGAVKLYSGYKQLESELHSLLHNVNRIAMEYSPMGRLPYVGLVEAGTIELIRDLGPEIVSSADMVALFMAALTPEQMAMARMAARNLIEIKDQTFEFIRTSLTDNKSITEHDVCEFIRGKFDEYDMETGSGPNCSVDSHAGDPHYEPSENNSAVIKKGQLILVDMWARIKHDDAVYGDITWMAFAGSKDEIPAKYVEMFAVLVKARDRAVAFLRENIDNRPVYGYEVDDACREVIEKAGYGQYFVHRTGHSITTSEHGSGPNIDNLETEDRRKLQKGHLFSIEPGIYMTDCGFRTEIDVLIGHDGVEIVSLPLQTEIITLF